MSKPTRKDKGHGGATASAPLAVPQLDIELDVLRIDTSAATITDTAGTRPLVTGLGVAPGPVSVNGVRTDSDCPVEATFIPDDEAQTFPGNGTRTGSSPNFVWSFTWDNLPELGSNAVLRIEEMCLVDATGSAPLGFSGSTIIFTVHIFDSFDEDPTDIGPT
jgi:hypothetical protein